MAKPPEMKRVVAFIDGQNLFHAARECFGYQHPNFDVVALVAAVCAKREGWQPVQSRFYTGIPTAAENARWNRFWSGKLAVMGRQGVYTFTRPLRHLPGQRAAEKGIDIRIALDVISLYHRAAYDVALLFTQDQDLSEVAREIRTLAREHGRWIWMASAFPCNPAARKPYGVYRTEAIEIDKELYDSCLDTRQYFRDVTPST